MMLSKNVVLACLMAILTVSTCRADAPQAEVVLIRGGAGYWPGVRTLATELSIKGFRPRIIMGAMFAFEAGRIADDYESGRLRGPIVIVGYSSGADYACLLCSGLESRGIPVETLVLVESTLGVSVPANVEFCINLYKSRPGTDWIPAFRGVPVEAEGPNTELLNVNVNESNELHFLSEYNHFTIASNMESRLLISNLVAMRQSQFDQQGQQPTTAPSLPLPAAPQPMPLPPSPDTPDAPSPQPLTLPPVKINEPPPSGLQLPPSPVTQLPELHREVVVIPVGLKR